MSEPTTAAGRALSALASGIADGGDVWLDDDGNELAFDRDVLAIEQEAVVVAMAKLAEDVRKLTQFQFWPDEEPEAVLLAEVLALIEKATP